MRLPSLLALYRKTSNLVKGIIFIASNILRFPDTSRISRKLKSVRAAIHLKFSLLLSPEEKKWKDKICKHFPTFIYSANYDNNDETED